MTRENMRAERVRVGPCPVEHSGRTVVERRGLVEHKEGSTSSHRLRCLVEPALFLSIRRRTMAAAFAAPVFFQPGTEDYYTGTLSGLGRLYLEPTPGEVDRRPSSR
jgi:hypothetical protein